MIKVDKLNVQIKGNKQDIVVECINLFDSLYKFQITQTLLSEVKPNFYSACKKISEGCEDISKHITYKPAVTYNRISMRVMETPENLNSFKIFLQKMEDIGLIRVINDSKDYANRNSNMARNYYTIEFISDN